MSSRSTVPSETFAHYPSLAGRSAFVTGGGSGIGASIVAHLCHQGARVGFIDLDQTASERLVEDLALEGAPPLFVCGDLRDIAGLRRAIQQTSERLGPVTVLVNNAARDDRQPVAEVTPDSWDDAMAVNLRHQFFAAQAVRTGMREAGGGSIVNLGSISWLLGMAGLPAYVTAKAAVHGLTRGLAREFGPDAIRVNAVLPGWVMTERQLALWVTPDGERQLQESQCLPGRLAPDDVARMVLFLAADDSRMCTSQSFVVDAGWS